MKISDRIIDLFASSAVTQGTLSTLLVGGWIYMIVANVPVPGAYELATGAVIGFFFGGKVVTTAQSMAARRE